MRKKYSIGPIMVLLLMVSAAVAGENFALGFPFFQGNTDEIWRFHGKGSYLGIDIRDVSSERAAALKLKEESGAEIVTVDQDAPAGKAGLKEHDVIIGFNGQKVESAAQLRRMIRETPAGRKVTLGIVRDGQTTNIAAELSEQSRAELFANKLAIPPVPPMPHMPDFGEMDFPSIVEATTRRGVMVENITPQLASFFGLKTGETGVLVRSVEKGSAAEAAGLKAGDVIVRVDKEKIENCADWRRSIRGHSVPVPITVVRNRREQNLQITVAATT